jgi:hypothetical protein
MRQPLLLRDARARQACSHGLKVGLKDKVADVVRAALALIDADADGFLTRDEIRVYAAKVQGRCGSSQDLSFKRLAEVERPRGVVGEGGWGGLK